MDVKDFMATPMNHEPDMDQDDNVNVEEPHKYYNETPNFRDQQFKRSYEEDFARGSSIIES